MNEESTILAADTGGTPIDYPTEPVATWGEGVRILRIVQGLTQDELAERAGVEGNLIAELECGGVTTMSLACRRAVAEALHADQERLFPQEMTPCPAWCAEHINGAEDGDVYRGGYKVGEHRARGIELELGGDSLITVRLCQWEPVAGVPYCPDRWVELIGAVDLIPTSGIPALVAVLQTVHALSGEGVGR